MARIASPAPPALTVLPCSSVTVRTTRRFIQRATSVLLYVFLAPAYLGSDLPRVVTSIWLADAPYLTRKSFTVLARSRPRFSLYLTEPRLSVLPSTLT